MHWEIAENWDTMNKDRENLPLFKEEKRIHLHFHLTVSILYWEMKCSAKIQKQKEDTVPGIQPSSNDELSVCLDKSM